MPCSWQLIKEIPNLAKLGGHTELHTEYVLVYGIAHRVRFPIRDCIRNLQAALLPTSSRLEHLRVTCWIDCH